MGKTVKRPQQPKPKTAGQKVDEWVEIVSTIIKAIGPAGFFVMMLWGFIALFADKEQKTLIIDNWVLFKNENHIYCVLIILALITILILLWTFHVRAMNFFDKKLK